MYLMAGPVPASTRIPPWGDGKQSGQGRFQQPFEQGDNDVSGRVKRKRFDCDIGTISVKIAGALTLVTS